MKSLLFLIAAFSILPLSIFCEDEEEIRSKLPMLLGANNMGTDFWVTVPPVYYYANDKNYVKIFVATPLATKVTVEIKSQGYIKSFMAYPDSAASLSIDPFIAIPFMHGDGQKSPETQVYSQSAIHVTSESPVAVYVMVRFVYTADGYLAIPSPALGKKYIAQAFPEMGWNSASNGGHFPPWVMISAPYDDTKVNVKMGGSAKGNDALNFPGGIKIKTGQTGGSPVLKKGDVWCLTISDFFEDMTGTLIEADKPVSVISGHFCPNIPVGNQWCDYTVEMQPPVESWSETYVVPKIPKRRYNGVLRFFAANDNTEVKRNGEAFLTIPKAGGAAQGEGFIEERTWPKPEWPKSAVFTAESPIEIMYYNTCVQEDQAGGLSNVNSDPFMMRMVPVSQFQNDFMFVIPNSPGGIPFTENYLNVVFELNANGEMPVDLEYGIMETGQMKWASFAEKFPGDIEILPGEYDGKRFGVKTVMLPDKNHALFGMRCESSKFMVYSYGYSSYDSYGFPAGSALVYTGYEGDLKSPEINEPVHNGNTISFGVSDAGGALHNIYLLGDASKFVTMDMTMLSESEAAIILTTSNTDDYRAEIMMIDKAGNKSYKVFAGPASSVREELFEEGELSISPNPVENMLNIEFANKATGRLKIEILDISGSLVKELADMDLSASGHNSLSYDTGGLPAGAYLLKIDMNGRSVIEKFVVRR